MTFNNKLHLNFDYCVYTIITNGVYVQNDLRFSILFWKRETYLCKTKAG